MSNLNKRIEPEVEDIKTAEEPKSKKKSRRNGKTNSTITEIMEGNMLKKEGFINFFPFLLYIVFLSMLYITNVYLAEDMSRESAQLKKKVENLHVEYVYLKSEITSLTKQSNMVRMLEKKGIKESVDPLKKIIVAKEGGQNERP